MSRKVNGHIQISAELIAILTAIVVTDLINVDKIAVCSDSMEGYRATKKGISDNYVAITIWREIIKRPRIDSSIQWMSCHCDIPGSE